MAEAKTVVFDKDAFRARFRIYFQEGPQGLTCGKCGSKDHISRNMGNSVVEVFHPDGETPISGCWTSSVEYPMTFEEQKARFWRGPHKEWYGVSPL